MSPAVRVSLRIAGLALIALGSGLVYAPAGIIVLGLGVGAWGYRGGI